MVSGGVLVDGVGERRLALLGELEDHGAGEGLGDRTDPWCTSGVIGAFVVASAMP